MSVWWQQLTATLWCEVALYTNYEVALTTKRWPIDSIHDRNVCAWAEQDVERGEWKHADSETDYEADIDTSPNTIRYHEYTLVMSREVSSHHHIMSALYYSSLVAR